MKQEYRAFCTIFNSQAGVQHKRQAVSAFSFLLAGSNLAEIQQITFKRSVRSQQCVRIMNSGVFWYVHSPSLIRGSTNIYLFAFQTKGSLLNNISALVNIGTVQAPRGELDDVFINLSTLYGAAVFLVRLCFLSP